MTTMSCQQKAVYVFRSSTLNGSNYYIFVGLATVDSYFCSMLPVVSINIAETVDFASFFVAQKPLLKHSETETEEVRTIHFYSTCTDHWNRGWSEA